MRRDAGQILCLSDVTARDWSDHDADPDIDALFDIEREINGMTATQRRTIRGTMSGPLVAELEQLMRAEWTKLSWHAPTAQAIMLKRWDGFAHFPDLPDHGWC